VLDRRFVPVLSGDPSKLLFTASNWTFPLLERIREACEEVAFKELGLDIYPMQIEVISSEQMLDAYASIGLPIMYRHWSFGKRFAYNETLYRKGLQGLAYEIVINCNPCIVYIMEENSSLMHALVIAHAGYGHNHFFKNNYLYRQWTDAAGITDYLEFARDYVRKCEEKYGEEAVERTLDAAHTLRDYVDRHPRKKISFADEKRRREERRTYEESTFNEVLHRTIPGRKPKPDEVDESDDGRDEKIGLPEANILYFLEKSAPKLKPWQRELLRIVRQVAQYFYPQRQTQVMNEGCATFVHHRILNRLFDKGMLSEGNMLEFIHSHSSVVFQPDFDDPRFSGINPYALGFAMMEDIERICNGAEWTPKGFNPCNTEQLAEDHEWFPDIAGKGDAYGVLRDAWANYRDESFILQYLSPRMMRKFGFFRIDDKSTDNHLRVAAIANRSGYRRVREALARQYDLARREPEITVIAADDDTHTLVLEHRVYDGVLLDEKTCKATLDHVAFLWGGKVNFVEKEAGTDKVLNILQGEAPVLLKT